MTYYSNESVIYIEVEMGRKLYRRRAMDMFICGRTKQSIVCLCRLQVPIDRSEFAIRIQWQHLRQSRSQFLNF